MYRIFILVFILFFFTYYSSSQDINKELKEDVYLMMKENSTSKTRKKIRKFFRILNSNDLSEDIKSKIHLVLTEFENRGLYLNAHYVKFFNLFLESYDSVENQLVFNNLLDFLIINKHIYSDINLKYLFSDLEKFLKHGILHQGPGFTWKCIGVYNIDVNENKSLEISFSDSDLILFNSRDTVKIFNIKGDYDLIKNTFNGEFGQSDYFNDDVFVEFYFNNFNIDLKKDFFSINNTVMTSFGAVSVSSEGVYKNNLSSSDNYPVFRSNSNSISLNIFNNFYVKCGFQLKGHNFFFNRNNQPMEMRFKNNKLDYVFISNDFQLKSGKLFSSNTNFTISNKLGSISHPATYFSYNDYDKIILIDRLSGKRGLNPIRNTFHGLNMFVDKLEIDLIDDNCFLFHYVHGNDISVLFESDNYFSQNKYRDIDRLDLNPLLLLLQFDQKYNHQQEYKVSDFSVFSGMSSDGVINILLELELFGFIIYNNFQGTFSILPWALNYQKSYYNKYDYDSFKIEALAGIGDTVANIDLYLNTMEINRIQKINLTNRFLVNLYPMSNRLVFFKNKSFYMDGNIDIGSFAFSGKNIRFEYDDFAFYFASNSLMSFIGDGEKEISSSLIHFDNGILAVDTLNNKSGKSKLNDFPKFNTFNQSYLSYDNNPIVFLLNPFDVNYLHDIALHNLSFKGNLFLDGVKTGSQSALVFNETNNLETYIEHDDFELYKGNVSFNGSLRLSEKGLFGSGEFNSDYVNFFADDIHLLSGKIVGATNSIINGDSLAYVPFFTKSSLFSFTPYTKEFLLKSLGDTVYMYDDFIFFGDIYFDSENLNGTGKISFINYDIESAHFYFSKNGIASADANFSILQNRKNKKIQFSTQSTSLEYTFNDKNIFLYKNNYPFVLNDISYLVDFDFALLDLDNQQIDFKNNNISSQGVLTALSYGRKAFDYNSLDANFNLVDNELCVAEGIQLEIKKFWIQPEGNRFCVMSNGDFPVFENCTLIKKRWLLKDKLINNKNVIIKPSLKHVILDN